MRTNTDILHAVKLKLCIYDDNDRDDETITMTTLTLAGVNTEEGKAANWQKSAEPLWFVHAKVAALRIRYRDALHSR